LTDIVSAEIDKRASKLERHLAAKLALPIMIALRSGVNTVPLSKQTQILL